MPPGVQILVCIDYVGGVEDDWIEHRRGTDGERVGWIKPDGEGFVAIDLLGRQRTDVVDWMMAEEMLDELGLSYLADQYELRSEDGSWLRVRIVEVSSSAIHVKMEDGGDINVAHTGHRLPFPIVLDQLRPAHR